MAVQIPSGVSRIAPQAPASAGRIEGQSIDPTRSMRAGEQGVNALVSALNTAANNTAETVGNERANALDLWWKEKTTGEGGLFHIKGDPTEAYAKFDEEVKLKIQELSENPGWTPGVADRVKQKLGNKYTSLQGQRITAFGSQLAKYKTEVDDNTVNLSVYNASQSMGLVNADDPTSFAPFEQNISEIYRTRINRGIEQGLAKETEDGKGIPIVQEDGSIRTYELEPSLAAQIINDTDKAAYGAVTSLQVNNMVDASKIMLEKYGHLFNPKNKAQAEKLQADRTKKVEAYKNLNKAIHLDADDQAGFLESISDPEVQHETVRLLKDNASRRNALEGLQSKKNYNDLASHVDSRMKSNQPYQSLSDAENDPVYVETMNKISDHKLRKAIESMVVKPKVSNQDTLTKMNDMIVNNELYDVKSYSDLVALAPGLNEKDMNRVYKEWERQRKTSDSEMRARVNDLGKQVKNQLPPLFMKGGRTKLRGKEQEKLNEIQFQIREEMWKLPKMTPQEYESWTRNRISNEIIRLKKEGTSSSGGSWFNWFGGSGSSSQTNTTGTQRKRYNDLDTQGRQDLIDRFNQAHGRRASSKQELEDWWNSTND